MAEIILVGVELLSEPLRKWVTTTFGEMAETFSEGLSITISIYANKTVEISDLESSQDHDEADVYEFTDAISCACAYIARTLQAPILH